MVKKIKKDENIYFQFEECKLGYKNKKWTEKCQVLYKKNKTCNLEITKHAIK